MMAKVFGDFDVILLPGVAREEFVTFVQRTSPMHEPWPGIRGYVLSGDRGDGEGRLHYLIDMASEEIRNRYFPPGTIMYGEQGKAFVPLGRAVEGKEALQIAWQEGLDNGVRRVAIETHEVEQDGALGYESGSYAILDPQGAVFESGSYVIVWRRENGAWKWHRHIWTPHVKVG